MRVAYADPPYPGQALRHYSHDVNAREVNHRLLIGYLDSHFDGWALSTSSPGLRLVLPLCPDDVRVMAWVKPFAAFKRNVPVAYAWEPVIVKPCRKPVVGGGVVSRDWVSANITMKRGLTGVKPGPFRGGFSRFWGSGTTTNSKTCSPAQARSLARGSSGEKRAQHLSPATSSRGTWRRDALGTGCPLVRVGEEDAHAPVDLDADFSLRGLPRADSQGGGDMEPMTDVHAVLLEKEKRRQEKMERVRRLTAAVSQALTGDSLDGDPVPARAVSGFALMVDALLEEESEP